MRSPAPSLFLTVIKRITQRAISTLKSSSPYSSSVCLCLCDGSWQHVSWTLRKLTASFRWLAVDFCASLKVLQMRTRSEDDGPSSGITMADGLVVVVLREFKVCEDGLLARCEAVEALAETRPGIL